MFSNQTLEEHSNWTGISDIALFILHFALICASHDVTVFL